MNSTNDVVADKVVLTPETNSAQLIHSLWAKGVKPVLLQWNGLLYW